ncbi:MAG: NTP transferase domain-containing protein [Burkholderiaceae bacterium]
MAGLARWSVLILAAGQGRRLGHVAKGLIRLDGQTLVKRMAQAVSPLSPVQVLLVTGRDHDRYATEVSTWPAAMQPDLLRNPDPADDPAQSLHLGLARLAPGADAVMVLLSDLPLLTADDIKMATQAFAAREADVELVLPVVRGTPGHPVMFSRALACHLLSNPDVTLRQWRTEHPAQTGFWRTENDNHIRDIDRQEDLEGLRVATGSTVELPGAGVLDDPKPACP